MIPAIFAIPLLQVLPSSDNVEAFEKWPLAAMVVVLILAVGGLFLALMKQIQSSNTRMDNAMAQMVEIVERSISQDGKTENAILKLAEATERNTQNQAVSHQAIMIELGKLATEVRLKTAN